MDFLGKESFFLKNANAFKILFFFHIGFSEGGPNGAQGGAMVGQGEPLVTREGGQKKAYALTGAK